MWMHGATVHAADTYFALGYKTDLGEAKYVHGHTNLWQNPSMRRKRSMIVTSGQRGAHPCTIEAMHILRSLLDLANVLGMK